MSRRLNRKKKSGTQGENVMRKLIFIFTLFYGSTQAMAADLCDGLHGKELSVNAANFSVVIGSGGLFFFGNYFVTVVKGTQDAVPGSCSQGVLNFTWVHQGPKPFTRHFVGLLAPNFANKAAGVF